jgi:hypothetical protein
MDGGGCGLEGGGAGRGAGHRSDEEGDERLGEVGLVDLAGAELPEAEDVAGLLALLGSSRVALDDLLKARHGLNRLGLDVVCAAGVVAVADGCDLERREIVGYVVR